MDLIDNEEIQFMYGHAAVTASSPCKQYVVTTNSHAFMWRLVNPQPEMRLMDLQ